MKAITNRSEIVTFKKNTHRFRVICVTPIEECFNFLNYLKIEKQDSKSHKSKWTLTEVKALSVYPCKDTREKTWLCRCPVIGLPVVAIEGQHVACTSLSVTRRICYSTTQLPHSIVQALLLVQLSH